MLPTFSTDQERTDWIIKNAEYFTTIVRRNGINERGEYPNLPDAESAARRMAKETNRNCMIYAVGPMGYSAYIKTISP